MGLNEIRNIKAAGGVLKPKKTYSIPKKSKKRIKMEMDAVVNDENLDKWFEARRKDLVGTCQCGCGQKSQKKDDMYYRHSICHLLPKRLFKSVMCHPLNFVERAFWGGCHSVLDDTSVDRWSGMADFDDIKAKFYVLEQFLTEEEKARKFYRKLKSVIDNQ